MEIVLHIFRRDLRLVDNRSLEYAHQQGRCVIPAFIFDPRQIDKHPYKSEPALAFMLDALEELQHALRRQQGELFFFYGQAEEILAQLLEALPIGCVTFHREYTPFGRRRDEALTRQCMRHQVRCYALPDLLLNEPETIYSQSQQPYTLFTPFYRCASQKRVALPAGRGAGGYYNKAIALAKPASFLEQIRMTKLTRTFPAQGGRTRAQDQLKKASGLVDYPEARDYPARAHTSHLSAHLKFGTLSVREVHQGLAHLPALVRQLYWRDFFTHIAYHYPHVFGRAFKPRYAAIPWRNDPDEFKAWQEGRTGFPIVDAGMRELNTTGYMHNRVRLITASFLVKHLQVDWRLGERYFAQRLMDYDPSVNNGNWQWVASTGFDSTPYFRIFNPWRQQARFDPEALYIKRWIKALLPFTAREIHRIPEEGLRASSYPAPLVEHKQAVGLTKTLYTRHLK